MLKGAKICTPVGFSHKQALIKAVIVTIVENLFNDNKTEIGENMRTFVEMCSGDSFGYSKTNSTSVHVHQERLFCTKKKLFNPFGSRVFSL